MRRAELLIAVVAFTVFLAVAVAVGLAVSLSPGRRRAQDGAGGEGGAPGEYRAQSVGGDGHCFYLAVYAALQSRAREVFGCGATAVPACLRGLLVRLSETEPYRSVVDEAVRRARAIGVDALRDDLGDRLAPALHAGDRDAIRRCFRGEWATELEVTIFQMYLRNEHGIVLVVTGRNPSGGLAAAGAVPAAPDGYHVAFLLKTGGSNHYDAWTVPGGPLTLGEYTALFTPAAPPR
eukprot:jgi/Tetstr1/454277/TSEL_041196.t1